MGAYDLREPSTSSAMIMNTKITVKLILPAFGPNSLGLCFLDKETHAPGSVFCCGTSGLDIGQLTVGGFL